MATDDVQLDQVIQHMIDTNVAMTRQFATIYTAFRAGVAEGATLEGNTEELLFEIISKTGNQIDKTVYHEEQLQIAARDSYF